MNVSEARPGDFIKVEWFTDDVWYEIKRLSVSGDHFIISTPIDQHLLIFNDEVLRVRPKEEVNEWEGNLELE